MSGFVPSDENVWVGQREGGVMRALLVLATTIAVGVLVPLTASAQTIRLKNGNTLHGEVKDIDEQQVVVEIPGVGKMTFDKSEIAAIEEPTPQAVQPTRQLQTSIGFTDAIELLAAEAEASGVEIATIAPTGQVPQVAVEVTITSGYRSLATFIDRFEQKANGACLVRRKPTEDEQVRKIIFDCSVKSPNAESAEQKQVQPPRSQRRLKLRTDLENESLVGAVKEVRSEIGKMVPKQTLFGARMEEVRIPYAVQEFSREGHLLKAVYYNDDGSISTTVDFAYRYGNDGRVYDKSTKFDRAGVSVSTYYYYDEKNWVEEKRYIKKLPNDDDPEWYWATRLSLDDRLEGKPYERVVYRYDVNGNLAEETRILDSHAKEWREEKRRWRSNTSEEAMNRESDDETPDRITYRYDASGRLTEKAEYQSDAILVLKTTYAYDSNGKLAETISHDRHDSPNVKCEYSYGSETNWNKATYCDVAVGSERCEVVYRTITYYQE